MKNKYVGNYCALKSSSDGKARLSVHLYREKRTGNDEYLELEVTINRSDVSCIVHAMRAFLAKEQEELNNEKF